MAEPKITIDDRAVSLFGAVATAHAAIEPGTEFLWIVQFGVVSPVVEWELEPDLADYVLSRKEVSIHIEGFGSDPLDIKRVVVIGLTGSTNPRRARVQLGDIRRYLRYSNPVAALNVRAETGNNSTNGFAASGQFIQAIPQFAYRLYSVKGDGSSVGPPEVIKKVMDLASQDPGDWKLDSQPRATLIPNDIQLYDQGDISVARMLGTIGGLDMYVDPADGLMHITNRVAGDEKKLIESLIPSASDLEGAGKIVWRDERHNRPASFDILTDPKVEFRTDFIETTGSQGEQDDFWSENVAEVMEYRPGFYLATTPNGLRQSLPGEYLNLNQFLATMPNGPLVASLPISLLQAGYNNSDLIYGILGDGQIPDPGEEARIRSLLEHYRTTFRLNRRITSRCRPGSIQAVMVAVADAETGTPKPSDVYVDHCVIPTLEVALGNTDALQGWNRDSFPPRDTTANGSEKVYQDSPLLTSMRVAPFNCEMINSDAGLYSIAPRPDFQDERQSVVPCRVLNIPTLDYTAANNSLALFFWDQAPVAAGHRMTVILSAIPGVGEFHTAVSVAEAAQRLGIGGVEPGIAPVMVVRIGPDLLPAKFPWDDAQRQQVKDLFLGTLVNTDKDPLKTMKPSNQSDITDYARGFCAAVLANYLPHYEGLQSIKLTPGAKPAGACHTIVHRVGPHGDYKTTLNCNQVRDPFIAEHFLTASTLATLRGRVTT